MEVYFPNVVPLEYEAKVRKFQKCLVPAKSLKNPLTCGAWVRCTLLIPSSDSTSHCYAVCQIYESEESACYNNLVYMDLAVTVGIDEHHYAQRLQGVIINSLDELKEAQVDEINIVVKIDKVFHKMGKSNISAIARTHLQAYCLVNGCTVRSAELERLGISAIDVYAKFIEDEHDYFKISNKTRLQIADVSLILPTPLTSLKVFHTIGFEDVLQELNDLLKRPKNLRRLTNSNALIVGPLGCGKSSTIAYFVQKNNCNYFHISIGTVLGQYPGEAESKLRDVFTKAKIFALSFKPKAPIIIHLEDLHLLCHTVKTGSKDVGNSLRLLAQLNLLLDNLNSIDVGVAIYCLATTLDARLLHKSLLCPGRFHYEININPFSKEHRRNLFQLLYEEHLISQSLTEETLESVIAQTSGYVISDLKILVRTIEQRLLHNTMLNVESLINEILSKIKPVSIRSADVLAIKAKGGFEKIGGMNTLKDTLRLGILSGMTRAAAFKRFGLSLPRGILLYGPPGCAKTKIAKCLAAEAKMNFIATSGAEVYSPYVGCAEKFITKLFDTARNNAPCLLFLDEIDTLVGCRGARGTKSSNEVQTRILSTLLTEMDGIVQTRIATDAYILVVGATNRPHMLDDALLRAGRFDQLIHVPAPDCDSRFSILELHKQYMPFADDCNLLEIAERTENFSGADICNLCNEAAMNALSKDMNAFEITADDFNITLRKQKPSLSQRQIDFFFLYQNGLLR